MATESFYTESGTSPPTLAWHYTTMPRFESIKSTGRINRATALVEKGERAAAWFTTSNNFEATALLGNGSRTLTLEEQCGLVAAVRIGVKVNRLDSYKTWKRNSKCSRRMQEALERAAIAIQTATGTSASRRSIGLIGYALNTAPMVTTGCQWRRCSHERRS